MRHTKVTFSSSPSFLVKRPSACLPLTVPDNNLSLTAFLLPSQTEKGTKRHELLGWSYAKSSQQFRVATTTFRELLNPSELEGVIQCDAVPDLALLRVDDVPEL